MNCNKLKENRQHGTPYLPIGAYETYLEFYRNTRHIDCHWHDEWEFFLVEEGSAWYGLNGVKTLVTEGSVVFIPSGNLHVFESVNGKFWRFKAVVFSSDMLRLLSDELVESKYIRPLIEGRFKLPSTMQSPDAGKLFEHLYNLVKNEPPFYELHIKACLFELLACLMECAHLDTSYQISDKETPCQMKHVLNYIHKHYADDITVAQLSGMAHMSAGYFTKIFRRYTAKSPMDYVIKLRLSKAAVLLKESDEKLTNIALDAGFNNLSYFIRTFQTHFQCTPTEYRRNQKNKAAEQLWQ